MRVKQSKRRWFHDEESLRRVIQMRARANSYNVCVLFFAVSNYYNIVFLIISLPSLCMTLRIFTASQLYLEVSKQDLQVYAKVNLKYDCSLEVTVKHIAVAELTLMKS